MGNQNKTNEMWAAPPPFDTPYLIRPYGEAEETYGVILAAIAMGVESIAPRRIIFDKLDPETQVLRAIAYAEHLTVEKRLGNTYVDTPFDQCMVVLVKQADYDLLRNQMTRSFYHAD